MRESLENECMNTSGLHGCESEKKLERNSPGEWERKKEGERKCETLMMGWEKDGERTYFNDVLSWKKIVRNSSLLLLKKEREEKEQKERENKKRKNEKSIERTVWFKFSPTGGATHQHLFSTAIPSNRRFRRVFVFVTLPTVSIGVQDLGIPQCLY